MKVTPNDGGGGGIFTPASIDLDDATPSGTFSYKPALQGNKIIGVTNDGGYRDPAALSYNALAIPQTVAGLAGWWEADSLVLADGAPCTLWPDLNGNVRDAVAVNPPYYAANVLMRDLLRDALEKADIIRPSQLEGTPYATTGPALYFPTGANCYFNFPSFTITGGYTLFFFGYWGMNGNAKVMSNGAGAPSPEAIDCDGPNWYFNDAYLRWTTYGDVYGVQNSFQLVTCESDYGGAIQFRIWQNGQPRIMGNSGPWASGTTLDRIGMRGDGSPCNAAYMKAILLYAGILSTIDRMTIQKYIGDKQGIWTPPVGAYAGAPVVDVEYTTLNAYNEASIDGVTQTGSGQSFQSTGGRIAKVPQWIWKVGAPTGNAYVKIYEAPAHAPTRLVATSDPIDVATLPASLTIDTPFVFSGGNQIHLKAGAWYFASIEWTGAGGQVHYYFGDSGNPGYTSSLASGAWAPYNIYDTILQVWVVKP
jgi:hypothetical protein